MIAEGYTDVEGAIVCGRVRLPSIAKLPEDLQSLGNIAILASSTYEAHVVLCIRVPGLPENVACKIEATRLHGRPDEPVAGRVVRPDSLGNCGLVEGAYPLRLPGRSIDLDGGCEEWRSATRLAPSPSEDVLNKLGVLRRAASGKDGHERDFRGTLDSVIARCLGELTKILVSLGLVARRACVQAHQCCASPHGQGALRPDQALRASSQARPTWRPWSCCPFQENQQCLGWCNETASSAL
mmetsp:Transcript_60142/g.129119  ORF Transcript_60142/g.129119 Transcript_60142/m.129119 type:complete len:240 (-) Transcript_60142:383-1102(-)